MGWGGGGLKVYQESERHMNWLRQEEMNGKEGLKVYEESEQHIK